MTETLTRPVARRDRGTRTSPRAAAPQPAPSVADIWHEIIDGDRGPNFEERLALTRSLLASDGHAELVAICRAAQALQSRIVDFLDAPAKYRQPLGQLYGTTAADGMLEDLAAGGYNLRTLVSALETNLSGARG